MEEETWWNKLLFDMLCIYTHVKWDANVTITCLLHLSQHVNHIIFSFYFFYFFVSLLCLVTVVSHVSDNDFANSQGKNVYIELVFICSRFKFNYFLVPVANLTDHWQENLKRHVRDALNKKRLIALILLDSPDESIIDLMVRTNSLSQSCSWFLIISDSCDLFI